MFECKYYNYPIDKILEALGSREGRGKDMWFSPFREEKEASLHIDRVKNVWYDHGAGVGGTCVQLVTMAKRCSTKEAYKFIEELGGSSVIQTQPHKPDTAAPAFEIRSIKEIQSNYLLRYLESRKIPVELASRYCKEILVYHNQRQQYYRFLGFPNNPGGYAMRSPGFKSTNKAGITTINTKGEMSVIPTSKKVAVFEGFFDFLSWQVLQSSTKPSCDVVVLNSVNNLQRASAYISSHEGAVCFLDNDMAGEKCYQGVRDLLKSKNVLDMSDLYGQYKDLNEMLQASRGYTSSMHITPCR